LGSTTDTRAGLYRIRNRRNEKVYYGSSDRVGRRLTHHRQVLARGAHENRWLPRAWNKDGKDCFEFTVVAVLEPGEERAAEQRLLDRVVGRPDCYEAWVRRKTARYS